MSRKIILFCVLNIKVWSLLQWPKGLQNPIAMYDSTWHILLTLLKTRLYVLLCHNAQQETDARSIFYNQFFSIIVQHLIDEEHVDRAGLQFAMQARREEFLPFKMLITV